MNNKFKFYRSQILFIGLSTDEMMKIEAAFNKYSVFYKDSISNVNKVESFDLIYIAEEDYRKNSKLIDGLKIPFVIIGEIGALNARGVLKKPLSVRACLESVHSLLPPVKTPSLAPIEIGTIVRSKTTPNFGKGIVVSIFSDHEVSVRFPNTHLIDKNKQTIRCHKSQLQILGSVDDILSK